MNKDDVLKFIESMERLHTGAARNVEDIKHSLFESQYIKIKDTVGGLTFANTEFAKIILELQQDKENIARGLGNILLDCVKELPADSEVVGRIKEALFKK